MLHILRHFLYTRCASRRAKKQAIFVKSIADNTPAQYFRALSQHKRI